MCSDKQLRSGTPPQFSPSRRRCADGIVFAYAKRRRRQNTTKQQGKPRNLFSPTFRRRNFSCYNPIVPNKSEYILMRKNNEKALEHSHSKAIVVPLGWDPHLMTSGL